MINPTSPKTIVVSNDKISIDVKDVCRYMGLGRNSPDENLLTLINSSIEEYEKYVSYKASFIITPVSISEEEVDFLTIKAKSKSLSKHLLDCKKAIIFAATTGLEAERQRKRAAVLSSAKALVLDAIGTSAIESLCDFLCDNWADEYEGRMLRPRFSPGYGDLPLEFQTPLINAVEASKMAGISLTEALLMIPQKSVSAIIGVGKNGCTKKSTSCYDCDKTDCDFRL